MELEEMRILQARGKFSTDVSLPAWWLKAHSLSRGSKVKLIATEDEVKIIPVEDK